MTTATADSAKEFVANLHLGIAPQRPFGVTENVSPFKPLDNQQQAVVVGADVVSFTSQVSAQRRQDIQDCTLLAQLAANAKVNQSADIFAWYDTYFDVLSNLGWTIASKQFNSQESHGEEVDVHEAIIAVATALLGAGSTGLALVITTLNAMKTMNASSPWITIFKRESHKLKAQAFQIAVVEQDSAGQTTITLMAFTLNVSSVMNQIVFFKIKTDDVTLQNCSGSITINEGVLNAIRETLRKKVQDRAEGFVGALQV
ncbi:hypothetical protein [Pseudomonas sp. NPDC089569]|uniref:hypothetical protein n=1 Tax=Pseudomonas sp. NPDC089569 TaxID=3390722 RepID=UPI003D005DA5